MERLGSSLFKQLSLALLLLLFVSRSRSLLRGEQLTRTPSSLSGLPVVERRWQQQHGHGTQVNIDQSFQTTTGLKAQWNPHNSKSDCVCPEDEEDDEELLLESRREALFAMMGTLWAAGTLPESLLGSAAPANAAYGVDANMAFPDVVQGLSDRANKQCLVESLGNRECLVYQEDEEKLLYKGADSQILLNRIQVAAKALETEIPPLVAKKQWTKITGVLTGPMGQLSSTMTLLCKLADKPDVAKQKAQVVKQDVFAMGTATTNKAGSDVLKYQQLAIQDLAVFLKSL